MNCGAVATGTRFVAQMIGHIDCQAEAIGAYGYGALADPGSPVSMLLTALLAIFVALLGLRLLTGGSVDGRDMIGDFIKIGVVLTLATSWPAWRTLGYDLVLRGPAELTALIEGAADLPGRAGDIAARLQEADDAISVLTVYGTGRNTGGLNRSDTVGDSFRGIALADQEGLAKGRMWFLVGVLGPLAIVRLTAGLLLALAPLMAGLLLFAGTRDLFFGWLRGLFLVGLGALALHAVHGVELAILMPWVRDAIAMREAQLLTPSAPTELSVITLAFTAASFGVLVILAKIAFFGGFGIARLMSRPGSVEWTGASEEMRAGERQAAETPSRAMVLAESVSESLRRGDRLRARNPGTASGPSDRTMHDSMGGSRGGRAGPAATETAGISRHPSVSRQYRRSSTAGSKRDLKG